MAIPTLAKNLFPRRKAAPEPVYYDLKPSPKAARDMNDLAKSLGETPSVLIANSIVVYSEIMRKLLEQGGGKLYMEDFQGNRAELTSSPP